MIIRILNRWPWLSAIVASAVMYLFVAWVIFY